MTFRTRCLLLVITALVSVSELTHAEPPSTAYIFPAGGQRGQKVDFKVGGFYLHEGCGFRMDGGGVKATDRITRTETVFFEGPVIPMPASQRKEDYPKDYVGEVQIDATAAFGPRMWRVWNSQGITASRKFVIGNLPEVVEDEIDGAPIPTKVQLPVTINGRIFPREDVDIWTFDAGAGETITCEVNAARLGSALDSRIEIRDPDGRRISENVDTFGSDSFVRFKTPRSGKYSVHIHDINFGGFQHYVYRLTVTNAAYIDCVYPLGGQRGKAVELELTGVNLPVDSASVSLPQQAAFHRHAVKAGDGWTNTVLLDVGEHTELRESEPNDNSVQATAFSVPAILNGRIQKSGDFDVWSFTGKKDDSVNFEVRSAQLGTALDSVLTLTDSNGKQLARNDDVGGGNVDSKITVKLPADGTYALKIEDSVGNRGNNKHFAYRIVATKEVAKSLGFEILLPADVVNLNRGQETHIKYNVNRFGGFNEEINLELVDAPEGISLSGNTKVGRSKTNGQLTLKAESNAVCQQVLLKLRGTGKTRDKENPVEVTGTSRYQVPFGDSSDGSVLLSINVPTPFKFTGEFESPYGAAGTVLLRKYTLDRGGYDGPIEVSMADTQARHLQGVKGPKIVVPPGATEFEYPVTLPSWMEVGRTSRTTVMAVAVVKEPDGSKHKVSYTSAAQNDQIIALVAPKPLSIVIEQPNVRVLPGRSIKVPFKIGRSKDLKGAVVVELHVPRHVRGVAATPVNVAAGATTGILTLQFDPKFVGPFNQPLTLHASMKDSRGLPVTSEVLLEATE